MVTFGAPSTIVTASAQFPSFHAEVIAVPTPGTAVNLPNLPIPNGAIFALRAKASNKKNSHVFVGNASPIVVANRITLGPGEAIELSLTNANVIFVDTDDAGSAVEILVEQ